HRREEISDRLSVITNNAHLAPADKSASSRAAVPMDPEDSLTDRDILRPLLWTRYQRSPLVFGSDPLPWDDTYAAKLTACLGQAWNFALPLFEPGRETHIPYRRRVTALLRLFASGLQAALPSPDQRAKYILYHRDWIIRFHSLRSGKGQEKAQKLLDMFDHKLSPAGAISKEIFGCLTDICSTPSDVPLVRWQAAVSQLESYWRCSAIGLRVFGPFAPDAMFPVLFRLFHSLANGLGVTPLNEGIAYHLLLASVSALPFRVLVLLPPQLASRVPSDAQENPPVALSFDFEHESLWTHYVAASGLDGSRWAEDYRAVGRQLGPQIDRALDLLRRKQLDSGRGLLEEIDGRRHILIRESPSVGHVLSRFYYGALSYWNYAKGAFQGGISFLA